MTEETDYTPQKLADRLEELSELFGEEGNLFAKTVSMGVIMDLWEKVNHSQSDMMISDGWQRVENNSDVDLSKYPACLIEAVRGGFEAGFTSAMHGVEGVFRTYREYVAKELQDGRKESHAREDNPS